MKNKDKALMAFQGGGKTVHRKYCQFFKHFRGGLAMNSDNFREKDYYKEKIIEMVGKIENPSFLKRIYQLTEYLYIHKKEKE